MSYYSISHQYLANHLIYLSLSSSFWFSLNSSYEHDFQLSKPLGMTPKDYEYLLVAADLAHIDKRWGFSIKMIKWKLFLEGHHFTTINCDGTAARQPRRQRLARRRRAARRRRPRC
jgi:hypothetical protein